MTRALDKQNDWTFGSGIGNYIAGDYEIIQNVRTRILSFKNDWYLDEDAEIDWLTILGQRNNKATIEAEVQRVTEETDGVLRVLSVDVVVENRIATILLKFDTVNKENLVTEVVVNG